MDYKKKGEEELDLVKDDALRVFKRYNHWSYVSLISASPFYCLSDHISIKRRLKRLGVTEVGCP